MWNLGAGWLIVAVAACLAAAFFAVRLAKAKRAYDRAMEERGWRLERERESAAHNAVDAERARIARELHDIVSHNVSVMVVQAGAARQVLATQTDEATDALLAVETAGRDTMTELRHMLGLLAPAADGEDPGRLSPQPSLRRLSSLIDRTCFAGLPVEVRISGEPRHLPSSVDLTAYRIIQEALTNALKHGDGGNAEVTVRYAEHYLRVEVQNSGPSLLSRTVPAQAAKETGEGLGCSGCVSAWPFSAATWTPVDGSAAGSVSAPGFRSNSHDGFRTTSRHRRRPSPCAHRLPHDPHLTRH